MNKKVVSKFSFPNVYLMYGFMITILLLAVYLMSHAETMLHTRSGATMSAAYAGLMFLIIPLLYFYYNQKYVLKIYVTPDSIILKSLFWQRPYSVSEIQSIDLFARKNIGMLSSRNKSNGISITTYEESYFLNDLYYSNMPAIKTAVYDSFKSVINNPTVESHEIKSSSTTVTAFAYEKFYNNFIFAPDCITILICAIIFFFLFKQESTVFIVCMYLGLLFFLLLAFTFKANYFLSSSKELVIKNQLLRSRNIVFDFNDIQNIVLENNYKQSNSIRITTKNFRSRRFQSGGLWNSTWQRLTKHLQAAGVDVCNDI